MTSLFSNHSSITSLRLGVTTACLAFLIAGMTATHRVAGRHKHHAASTPEMMKKRAMQAAWLAVNMPHAANPR